MLKLKDKVRVKPGLVDGSTHGIIECTEEHVNASGMEGEVINVFGEGMGYQLSFDPSLTFTEDMLELTESIDVKEELNRMNDSIKDKRSSVTVKNRRVVVHERLENYVKMINKLEEVDRNMFFGMIYDKLESILFEEYGD